MKLSIFSVLALSFVSFATFSSLSSVSAQAAGNKQELAQVRRLADRKLNGTDVRKNVHVFDNVDNPCAEVGINYIVDVEVLKTVLKEADNGEITQVREWGLVNTYWITQAALRRGEDLSDDRCQE